jgi:signal-transduction protein with cAMP-binding, CBS, and nucleotidyltransferase domain
MSMKTIKDVLEGKGGQIWSIAPQRTVYEALKVMAEKNVGALVVLEGGRVVGILSERDYARKVILRGLASPETPVSKIMTSQVYYVKPEQGIEEAMALMTEKRVRHLPILENDQLVGVLSIGDLVKAIVAEKEYLINQLENYITGVFPETGGV